MGDRNKNAFLLPSKYYDFFLLVLEISPLEEETREWLTHFKYHTCSPHLDSTLLFWGLGFEDKTSPPSS